MQALAWWAIPIVATSVAIIWAIFAARPKGPADAHRTVAEHLAFRSALQSGNVRVQPPEASADELVDEGSDGPGQPSTPGGNRPSSTISDSSARRSS